MILKDILVAKDFVIDMPQDQILKTLINLIQYVGQWFLKIIPAEKGKNSD